MSDIESDYRMPRIEEFVQGFEFEVATDHGFMFIDTEKGTVHENQTTRSWTPCKVWWKVNPDEIITSIVDEKKVTYNGALNNFFKPFDEASFLEQGLIRVRK